MDRHHTHLSKFLSLVLRHKPEAIGIALDEQGWIEVETLLAAAAAHGQRITRDELDFVVANNNKKRFALSEDGQRIRASQGHSIEVDLGYTPSAPPPILYHGTATRHLDSIRRQGLVKGRRQHVHLSPDEATAITVGSRHGTPVVLMIRAGEMASAGHDFFISANSVWLTDHVPPEYIEPLGAS